MIFARAILVVALAALSACNSTLIVRTDGPYIGEHGISVPVPPPSLTAAPVQFVEVEGNLEIGTPEPKTKVFLYEGTTARGYFVLASGDGEFVFKGVELDLGDNCLEIWYEEPGPYGLASVHSFFFAYIGEDDQTVVTEQLMAGC